MDQVKVQGAGEAVRVAAHKALGEWLAWPDAARDGPVAVDDEKVLSWLSGLPNKLAALSQPPEASEGEAVAWMYVRDDERFIAIHKNFGLEEWTDDDRNHHKAKGFTETPLGKITPKPTPMQEVQAMGQEFDEGSDISGEAMGRYDEKHGGDPFAAPTPEARALRAHIAEQITHAENRIQDGIEMGASVWRIALEDIVREGRAALTKAGGEGSP